AGVLVNGQSYTWQVRTRSNNGLATYGPYSTSAHFQMQAFDPDAPPPPVNAALVPLPQVLGTGTSRAFIYDQRGEQRILELSNVSSLSWSRRINEVSDASVIVDVPGGGEREECCGDLGNIHVWHHSLVIFREVDGTPQRVWEGPIRRLGYRPGQVTIDARDVSGWLEHRRRHTYRDVASSPVTTEMMLSLQRAFTSPVVTSPAETSDPNVLPWVINYGTLTEPVSMGPAVSRDVLPNEAFYIDDLNSFVDMGGRWTVLGRSIIVFHDGIALGRTNTLLPSRDLQAEIEIVEDGDSLTTYGVARDDTGAAQAYYGPTGHTPIDAYYGLLDSVVSLGGGDTGASRAALIAAATAVWNQNYPAPILLNIPQDSTLSCDAPFPMQHLVCGTIVPIESTETCRDVSATMILSGVQVEQTAEGEQVAISLIPSSQRTTGIQGATFALDGLGLAPAAPVQFLPEPAATEPATQEVD
ncbi:MAG: hypothetical protein FWG11_07005, partial [Promicromonosporaceae bacterium]|nr:hypothetical protein [Promicromonosporaceae bacterium]